ncbi:MAG: sigma 54-interacting transcriptional regulator [Myxococcaceae bacterium]|nr:sigma 54-interacting transcriptional regulator [Myxococcaceae bacterium]
MDRLPDGAETLSRARATGALRQARGRSRVGHRWLCGTCTTGCAAPVRELHNSLRRPPAGCGTLVRGLVTSTHNLLPVQRPRRRRFVLILSESAVRQFDLPESGTVVVGRDPSVDIVLDDKAVSRRHAELVSYPDGSVEARDLGSQNGTRVRGVLVRGAVPLNSGDLLEIGNTNLFLEGSGPSTEDPHLRFERAFQQACARQRREAGALALVLLDADPNELGAALPRGFTWAPYAPGRFELLVPGTDAADVEAQLTSLEAQLRVRWPALRLASALAPGDGTTPDELLDTARSRLEQLKAKAPPAASLASPAMDPVRALVERIAPSELAVLVTGETGSGKQVIAELIHARSRRASGRFVRVNCAALPEQLLEAELFGYERGAFTGAVKDKPGLFEHATGGTLMLDEIGDMPLAMQAKLLQVLEERSVRRLGAVDPRPVDVRLIAATNKDLAVLSETQAFRADLYWRLNGATVTVPPLRERGDEVLVLARQFLRHAAAAFERPVPKLSPDAVEALVRYHWPGNVRQLRNVMERAVLMAVDGVVGDDLVPVAQAPATVPAMPPFPSAGGLPLPMPTAPPHVSRPAPVVSPPAPVAMRDEMAALERDRIIAALESTGNNQTKAAELLGIPRRTFLEKLDRHQIPRPRKPPR